MIAKRLVDSAKVVTGLAPITPSTSTPDYVSMKDYGHLTAIIMVDNATTVTGSAITLKQATAVAGTSEKALAFTKVWKNEDTAAAGGDALTETAVTSNTFTTVSTNNLNSIYVIEVDANELDINNGFDCVRVGTGDATAAVVSVVYILSNPRYAGASMPAAITD